MTGDDRYTVDDFDGAPPPPPHSQTKKKKTPIEREASLRRGRGVYFRVQLLGRPAERAILATQT